MVGYDKKTLYPGYEVSILVIRKIFICEPIATDDSSFARSLSIIEALRLLMFSNGLRSVVIARTELLPFCSLRTQDRAMQQLPPNTLTGVVTIKTMDSRRDAWRIQGISSVVWHPLLSVSSIVEADIRRVLETKTKSVPRNVCQQGGGSMVCLVAWTIY